MCRWNLSSSHHGVNDVMSKRFEWSERKEKLFTSTGPFIKDSLLFFLRCGTLLGVSREVELNCVPTQQPTNPLT